jgi:hypothetical protein
VAANTVVDTAGDTVVVDTVVVDTVEDMVRDMVRDTVHLDDVIRKVQWDTVVVWGRDTEEDSLTILRRTLSQVMAEITEVTIMVAGVIDFGLGCFD